MSRPQRRGSHSSNMLKPSVTIVQSEHNGDGSERRHSLSCNSIMGGMSSQNGTSMVTQPQQQQSGSAHQPQQVQYPQQQLSHSNTQVRSVASCMDLMSTSPFSRTFFSPQQQRNLFKSSSHHTSHTAAAGDLLSMSRRALEPPSNLKESVSGKKRSSTNAEDPGNDAAMDGMSIAAPQSNNTQQQNNIQTQHVSATPTDTSTFYNNGFNSTTATTKLCNTVSSSTFASQGGSDESYQQHRTIRRCQRSESFEMMEDD